MQFGKIIIDWYQHHQRDLPWRSTSDPYVIWLSEVILQQTRVEQGMPYFHRFLAHYPTVADFAKADEGEILKDWQGLGYYSRARNMHFTAKMVMQDYAGEFPKSYSELIKLKGIGEYTAAAIASFSNNEAKAVVDGNVFRLLSRYYGIDEPINSTKGKKLFFELANELIIPEQAGLYNQAVMEFGALQCKPKNPNCANCPLMLSCEAYKTNRVVKLPVKLKKLKIRERYFNYFVLSKDSSVLLRKRGPQDIWQNLYEFPLLESTKLLTPDEIVLDEGFIQLFGKQVVFKSTHGPVKHVLTHQKLYAQFFELEINPENINFEENWVWIDKNELENFAKPKLIFDFLVNFFKLN